MVPAQVQQRPAKSTALPLPRTNPVPEVATTSMLDRRKNDSKRQVPKHEFKYHPFIKLKKKEKERSGTQQATQSQCIQFDMHTIICQNSSFNLQAPQGLIWGRDVPPRKQKMVVTQ